MTGSAELVNDGQDISDLPPDTFRIGNTALLDGWLPIPVLIVAVVAVGAGVLLHRTRFGRHSYGIGSNPEASARTGIRVARHTTTVYGLAGGLATVADAPPTRARRVTRGGASTMWAPPRAGVRRHHLARGVSGEVGATAASTPRIGRTPWAARAFTKRTVPAITSRSVRARADMPRSAALTAGSSGCDVPSRAE